MRAAVRCSARPACAATSELQHELYRELHKMPPAAMLPTPETRACYERLGKIARSRRCRSGPSRRNAPASTWCGSIASLMPDKRRRSRSIRRRRCGAAWPRRWRNGSATTSGHAAAELGAPLAAITELDSYECRPRNNIIGAKLSEHGKGNALDIGARQARNGATLHLTDPLVSKLFRERMRASACARFTTVLGPGSDGYHESHIHLDLAERSHGYRICQWNVLDPAALAADVPLPRPRPIDSRPTTEPRSRNENGAGFSSGAVSVSAENSLSCCRRRRRPAPCAG